MEVLLAHLCKYLRLFTRQDSVLPGAPLLAPVLYFYVLETPQLTTKTTH